MQINWPKIMVVGIVAVLVIAAGVYLKQMVDVSQSTEQQDGPMEITDKERYWMNNKPFQLWRFAMLNLKILKAVDHSKRA